MKSVFGALAIIVGMSSATAWADLITMDEPVNPMGGYDMTVLPPPAPIGSFVNTINLSGSLTGQIEFRTAGPGGLLNMEVEAPAWWQNGNDPVYTTSVNWVEIILPANTQAFSFNVGAK